MEDNKVFKIRFNNSGVLNVVVVVAETYKEAESILVEDYKEYGIDIEILEYEEVEEKGVVMTWTAPLKTFHI